MKTTITDTDTKIPFWALKSLDEFELQSDTSLSEPYLKLVKWLINENKCFSPQQFSLGNTLINFNCSNQLTLSDLTKSETPKFNVNSGVIPEDKINEFKEQRIKQDLITFKASIEVKFIDELQITESLKTLGYSFEDKNGIVRYIIANPGLNHTLLEAPKAISSYINDYSLHLTHYIDCEENYEVLNLILYCNLPVNELIELENSIFDNWFERHYIEHEGKLTFRIYPK